MLEFCLLEIQKDDRNLYCCFFPNASKALKKLLQDIQALPPVFLSPLTPHFIKLAIHPHSSLILDNHTHTTPQLAYY